MAIFFTFAPFGAFSLLLMVTASAVAAFAAAILAAGLVIFDVIGKRPVKILAAGTLLMFGGMSVYLFSSGDVWSDSTLRMAVDCGLLAISLFSLAIRLPFTIQYARETVDAETAALPGFVQANYVLTSMWATAFVLMLAANLTVIYMPTLPLWTALVTVFGVRNAAIWFTHWYAQYRKDAGAQAKAAATTGGFASAQ